MTDTCPPVVQTINELPETAGPRDLYIRLHLGYVDYSQLEDLVQHGIEHLRERMQLLNKLTIDDVAEPFNDRDLKHAQRMAGEDFQKAVAIRDTIARKHRS